jgi:hypothetical protein
VLRSILPLLAFGWAALSWHDFYLQGMRGNAGATAAAEHWEHHCLLEVAAEFALDLPADQVSPGSDEVARTAPEFRPAVPDLFAGRSAGPVSALVDEYDLRRVASASRSTFGPPETPLHQRPARLLI